MYDLEDELEAVEQDEELGQRARPQLVRLWLCFCVAPRSRSGCLMNCTRRATMWLAGGTHHVEPVFEFDDKQMIAVNLSLKTGAVLFERRDMQRAYNDAFWTCYPIATRPEQLNDFYAFCAAQHRKPFNRRGWALNFIPVLGWLFGTRADHDSSWFCSQLVAAALRHSMPQRFAHLNPSRTNPGDLLSAVLNSGLQGLPRYMGLFDVKKIDVSKLRDPDEDDYDYDDNNDD